MFIKKLKYIHYICIYYNIYIKFVNDMNNITKKGILFITREKKTEDCPICCVDSIDSSFIVKCNKCHNICCKDCLKNYLLLSKLDTKCMYCNCLYDIDFILFNVDLEWYENKYKEYRKELLWKKEIIILKDIAIQRQFETYMNAVNYCKKNNLSINSNQISNLRFEMNEISNEFIKLRIRIDDLLVNDNQKIKQCNNEFNEFKEANSFLEKELKILVRRNKNKIAHLNCLLCINELGKGWENFDFKSGKVKSFMNNALSFSCSVTDCHGIVFDGKCNVCKTNICYKCREIINLEPHQCNEDTLQTIQLILENNVKCPKCSIYISKISGCDQMFCTQCHTTFSWSTGNIITGAVHNPHYFEWLLKEKNFNNDQVQVRQYEGCNNYIDYNALKTCFTEKEIEESYILRKNLIKLSNDYMDRFPCMGYYVIAFINLRQTILNIRSTSGNHVNIHYPDYHKLRFRLLEKKISEEEFKSEYYNEEFNFNKSAYYWEVYSTVTNIATILFDNLYSYTHLIKFKKMAKKIEKIISMKYIFSSNNY
jgi:hypothetical protein